MPAKNLHRTNEGGAYCHVYNKGVENRTLFADEADYLLFLSFLEEYLSAPKDLENKKTEFTIKGRSYKGIPHLPKNYHGKIELIAYCLKPKSFHLLLHQKTNKSLQAFLRSLCTRYSIYFNKKYGRTGSLFDGPYKSVHISDNKGLAYLLQHLNKEGNYTSQAEYSGQKSTNWVKTNIVLSFIKNVDNINDYIKDYQPSFEVKSLEEDSTPTTLNQPLERRNLEEVTLKPLSRIPELAAACAVLVLLLGFGIKNIEHNPNNTPTVPETLGTTSATASPGITNTAQTDLQSEATESAVIQTESKNTTRKEESREQIR